MIKVTQNPYKDMTACCEASLFEKSSAIKESARDDWALDDFGYFGTFPVEWKYCVGHEAPMAVYNYKELWVRVDGDFEKLPLEKDHYVLDMVTHYPYQPTRGLFFAVTRHHSRGKLHWYLNVFRRDGLWRLEHKLEGDEFGRPIQFWDGGTSLILQRSNSLALLNLDSFQATTIFDSGEASISNSHLTECGTRIGCVTVVGRDNDSLRFNLVERSGAFIALKEGENPVGCIGTTPMVLPLRAGNGMVSVEFRDA